MYSLSLAVLALPKLNSTGLSLELRSLSLWVRRCTLCIWGWMREEAAASHPPSTVPGAAVSVNIALLPLRFVSQFLPISMPCLSMEMLLFLPNSALFVLCNLLLPLCLGEWPFLRSTPSVTSLSHSLELPRCFSLCLTLPPRLCFLTFSTSSHSDCLFSLLFPFKSLLFPIL